jgi:hypothetical protein
MDTMKKKKTRVNFLKHLPLAKEKGGECLVYVEAEILIKGNKKFTLINNIFTRKKYFYF